MGSARGDLNHRSGERLALAVDALKPVAALKLGPAPVLPRPAGVAVEHAQHVRGSGEGGPLSVDGEGLGSMGERPVRSILAQSDVTGAGISDARR